MTVDQYSKGGRARAEALTPERRSEIARRAATARHTNAVATNELPRVIKEGDLKIGDVVLQCAVLDDEKRTRVITEATVARQLGRGLGGKSYRLREKQAAKTGGLPLPLYFAGVLDPYISNSLRLALSSPKEYRTRGGVRRGVDAMLLPEICEAWLKARDEEDLQKSQASIAKNAEDLMRALAIVGITALVDEATGYQEIRSRDELQRILEAYVSPEFLHYSSRFPSEYYEHLFRLRGWQYNPISVKRPNMIGQLTAKLIYEKLPPGVLDELRKNNPIIKKGKRRYKNYQFLTTDAGDPHLQKQVAAVTTLMKVSDTWSAFKRLFDKAFPPHDAQHVLPGMEENEDA